MPARPRLIHTAPAGLTFVPEFITRDEELAFIEEMEGLCWDSVVMHGVAARRSVVHFGFNYGFETLDLEATAPLPHWLRAVQTRAGAAAHIDPQLLEQLLVSSYPPGAGIGWHRDAPMFGEPVIGISLGGKGLMKFRRGQVGDWEIFPLWLPPRSLYLISGAARSAWQHSVMPVKAQRYSITWRTVRRDYRGKRHPSRENFAISRDANTIQSD